MWRKTNFLHVGIYNFKCNKILKLHKLQYDLCYNWNQYKYRFNTRTLNEADNITQLQFVCMIWGTQGYDCMTPCSSVWLFMQNIAPLIQRLHCLIQCISQSPHNSFVYIIIMMRKLSLWFLLYQASNPRKP